MTPRFRLKPRYRTFLVVAANMARFGFKLPHPFVNGVVRRGWEMNTPGGWQSIRLDSEGRVV